MTIDMAIDRPATEGRIVHVRTPGVLHCQPAIVVRNWGGSNPYGALNLQVFRDGSNDHEDSRFHSGDRNAATRWTTSVMHESTTDARNQSWPWPERV